MLIRNVAVIVSGMDEEYPYHIIRGINKVASDNFINISYFTAYGNIAGNKKADIGELGIYNLPDYSTFDGVILITNTFSDPDLRETIVKKVKKAGVPTVIFENKDHEEFYDISIDNYAVMKLLVEHLIHEHNKKVFNFVSGPLTNPEARDRLNAFKDALSENGITPDERRIFYAGFKSYDGIRAVDDFLSSGLPLPDAFVCANDSMALTLMSMLQRMGYRVPEDVIVTGFDHTFNARNSSPVLTTVRRPLYHSGIRALELLIDLMNNEQRPHHTLLDAEPVFAESCGCIYEETEDIIEFKRNTYQRMERTYTSVHMLNRLIASLSSANSVDECVGSLEQMLKTIGCEKFALCLISDWENTYHTLGYEGDSYYPEFMTAPLVWDKEMVSSVPNFPSSQLMPEPLSSGGNVSYYLPLNFGDRCLGYIIMTNCDFPIYSLLCHTMTLSISYAIEHVSKLNELDPLCKIYNRNGFLRNAEQIYHNCLADGSDITLAFVDLDGLKFINDTYGHQEGDYALRLAAEAMNSCCKGDMICARFGGDEFIAFGKKDTDDGPTFEERLTAKLSEVNGRHGKPYDVSASIGTIDCKITKETDVQELIRLADDKMYANKKSKKRYS